MKTILKSSYNKLLDMGYRGLITHRDSYLVVSENIDFNIFVINKSIFVNFTFQGISVRCKVNKYGDIFNSIISIINDYKEDQ